MLLPREQQVYALLMTRMSRQEIADELGITVYTMKNHIANICDKLGADNRVMMMANRIRELEERDADR